MPNTIVDTYLQHVNDSIKKYGDKTIVFLECGTFYEIYDVVPTAESTHLQCCENVLGILVTRKNKSDTNSPFMAGIPTTHIRRYNKMLLQQNYTIVFVGQKGEPPHITREVVQVMSPGCNLSEEVHESTDLGHSVLMTILIEEDSDGDCYAHLATFDTNCGTTHLESVLHEEDTLHIENVLATLQDTLHTFLFHELCIYTHNVSSRSLAHIQAFRETWTDLRKLVHYTNIQDMRMEHVFKRSFQQQFLERIFTNYASNFQSIWESLALQCTEGSCVATLVVLLHWVKEHDPRLVQSLQKPRSHQSGVLYTPSADREDGSTQQHGIHTYLTGYNELYAKLDIFEDTQNTLQAQPSNDSRSLFAMLNRTQTKMGERLLQQRLKRVIRCKQQIEKRYDLVNVLLNDAGTQGNGTYDIVKEHLKCIDLERMYRRFSLGELQPKDMPRILQSQSNLIRLFRHIVSLPESNKLHQLLKTNQIDIQAFEAYQKQLHTIFDEAKCVNVNLSNISDTLFNKGQFPEIDTRVQHLETLTNSVEDLALVLMECVPNMKLSGNQTRWIHVKHTDKDGHWLDVSKSRFKLLKDALDKMTPRMRESFMVRADPWSIDDLDFNTKNKTNVKISSAKLRSVSYDVLKAQQQIVQQVRAEYTTLLMELHHTHYHNMIEPIVEYVAELDVAFSTATNAVRNGYVRPVIVEAEQSSFRASALRHPLIEHLLHKSGKPDPYVPNDVALSHTSCWLLHGVNSVGKSSLLKSIATAVIMAQAGLFVSASSFTLSPYHKIFARTGNDDNIHVAHSSFVKEMSEARCIIEHADQYSLVIADELCASTELRSAVHIVGALLQLLVERRATFAFATHLFALQEHPFVSQLVERNVLRNLHLEVRFENEQLLFDRTLSDGLPTNRAYGVLVADKVIQNEAFTELLLRAQQVNSNTHTLSSSASASSYSSSSSSYSSSHPHRPHTHTNSSDVTSRNTVSTPHTSNNSRDTHSLSTYVLRDTGRPQRCVLNRTPSATGYDQVGHPTTVPVRLPPHHNPPAPLTLRHNPPAPTLRRERRNPKPSRYNKSLWMEECAICKYVPLDNYALPLDTHHIVEQHQANQQTGMIGHRFHKNQKHNLVALCKSCHQQIDTGELRINGYISTSNGPQLDWSHDTHN